MVRNIIVCIAIVSLVSCGKGRYELTRFSDRSANTLLTQSPVLLNQVTGIVPLGNLNPPDHALPTRHMYWYTGDPQSPPMQKAVKTE